MNILVKLKETAISVLPTVLIVLFLGLFVVPMDKILLARFVAGGFFLIIGLTIFLLGVDMGIQPMGERCGSELTKKRNLSLLLCSAFFIGFIVTAAEPDIQVFAEQVKSLFPQVNKLLFTLVIAFGVGIFVLLGLLRSVLNFSLKITLLFFYIILLLLTVFCSKSFTGIAFDSGGATTGPMTVPFIMALGIGVSTVRSKSESNSFGLTGIASVGPVLSVLLYSFFLKNAEASDAGLFLQATGLEEEVRAGLFSKIFMPFVKVFPSVSKESLISIAPLFALFVIFQFSLLKMTKLQVVRMSIGFIYSFLGLSIFLTGVNGGFMQAGKVLGEILGARAFANGGIWTFLLIITGLLFGAIIVCAEPAVWILSEQVETVSGGTIKRKLLLLFLSLGTALAIGLSLWRSISGFNIKYLLFSGYFLALLLMIFSPELFTGIAFDSGGVASGPLTSTFVLSFTIGAAQACGNNSDSFGVISLVALMPLIAIQIMGIIYKFKTKRIKKSGGDDV